MSSRPCSAAKRSSSGSRAIVRLVLGDDLAQHAGRVEAGQAGQVDRGLGVAGPLEHAALAVARAGRCDRAGPGRRGGSRVDEGGDGGGPVGGRDAGGGAVAVVDGHGERGAVALGVGRHHRRQVELVEALAGHRHADDARRVVQEEGDLLGRGELGRHDEVALVLAVLVVDHDDDLAAPDGGDGLLDLGERHASALPSWRSRRSTYLAITSTSRFTRSPGRRAERGDLGRVRDDGHGEPVVGHVDHGEADAVDGDRALLDDVAGVGGVRIGRSGRGLDDLADAVDVALHEVAAEAVRQADGRSRLTGRPGRRSPRVVRASVSSTTSADHAVGGPRSTTVRQQPLTAIESPTWRRRGRSAAAK